MSLQREMFERPTPQVVTLGLDLSLTATGAVVLGEDGIIEVSFTVGYPLDKNASAKKRICRLIDIWQTIWTQAFLARKDTNLPTPSLVGIEGYAYKAMGRGKEVAELHGLVKVMLYSQTNLVPRIANPSSVKKDIFGHGSLDKKEIRKIVDTLRRDGSIKGVDLKDHNQRDAWAIAHYVRMHHE